MVAGIYQHGKLLLLVAGIYISLLTHRLEVTCAFFNISRLNKSCQYFKMVDKKNNVTFHISEQLRVFSPCKKKFHHMKRKNLLNFGLGIPDTSVLHKEEWRENSVKKSDITNDVCLHTILLLLFFSFLININLMEKIFTNWQLHYISLTKYNFLISQ